ncbi:hypothetical protein PtB15_18B420 [Puccinia triticina]|nr:hypothetical protein PtB15_18B420 [Puccinia triticina]
MSQCIPGGNTAAQAMSAGFPEACPGPLRRRQAQRPALSPGGESGPAAGPWWGLFRATAGVRESPNNTCMEERRPSRYQPPRLALSQPHIFRSQESKKRRRPGDCARSVVSVQRAKKDRLRSQGASRSSARGSRGRRDRHMSVCACSAGGSDQHSHAPFLFRGLVLIRGRACMAYSSRGPTPPLSLSLVDGEGWTRLVSGQSPGEDTVRARPSFAAAGSSRPERSKPRDRTGGGPTRTHGDWNSGTETIKNQLIAHLK